MNPRKMRQKSIKWLENRNVPFMLTHPKWFSFWRVARVAHKVSLDASWQHRSQLYQNMLQAMRRYPDAGFELLTRYELAQPSFYTELQHLGTPPLVVECLRTMSEMSKESISSADFRLLADKLAHCSAALTKQLESQEVIPVEPLSPAEQREQLRFLLNPFTLPGPEHATAVEARRLAREADRKTALERAAVAAERQRAIAEKKRLAAEQAKEAAAEAERLEKRRMAELQAPFELKFKTAGVTPEHFPLDLFDEIRKGKGAKAYKEAYGVSPSLSQLRSQFKLTPQVYLALSDHKKGLSDEDKAKAAAERQQKRDEIEKSKKWHADLLLSTSMPLRLGITKKEYETWRADGRIKVSLWKTFRKWNRENEVALHHPDDFAYVTPELIAQWRAADEANLSPAGRAARKRSIDKIAAKNGLVEQVLQVEAVYGAKPLLFSYGGHLAQRGGTSDLTGFLAQSDLTWEKSVDVTFPVHIAGETVSWPARLILRAILPSPKNPEETATLTKRAGAAFSDATVKSMTTKLSEGVEDTLDFYSGSLTPEELTNLGKALKGVIAGGIKQADLEHRDFSKRLIAGPVRKMLDKIEAGRAQAILKLQDYPQAFPLARSLRRKVHFRLGPTNSGKTHDALDALKAAESGVYLAPLRLLAMEIRDRLVASGVPCNLLTGEEHEIVPGARHTACTVEMLDPTKEVAVAVLDEIQMLGDSQRGWAWTAALVGAPARNVYVCGAATVASPCFKLLEALGESYEDVRLERKTPLLVESQPVQSGKKRNAAGNGLQRGDAVIAFSRKDVLTLSARFRQKGWQVATIYGALAPEVRRTEAERFACGQADVVVATDAIGMGLNLPVRRVIFSTTHKFDGVRTRALNATEVQQIGGRAGRFGMHDEGFVSAFDAADLKHVRAQLRVDVPCPIGRLPIAPNFWHVEALSSVLRTNHIGSILTFFANSISVDSPLFETATSEDSISLGHVVDRLAPSLPLQDKFTFSCAPVSTNKDNERAYFEKCLNGFVRGTKVPILEMPDWVGESGYAFLEEAEHLSKNLSLYAWLSFKFPAIFYQGDAVPELRAATSRYLERALLRQGGFGQTSKEAYQERQYDREFGGYEWQDDYRERRHY